MVALLPPDDEVAYLIARKDERDPKARGSVEFISTGDSAPGDSAADPPLGDPAARLETCHVSEALAPVRG